MKKKILMLYPLSFLPNFLAVALLNIPQTYNLNRACDLRVEVQQGLSDIAK